MSRVALLQMKSFCSRTSMMYCRGYPLVNWDGGIRRTFAAATNMGCPAAHAQKEGAMLDSFHFTRVGILACGGTLRHPS